MSHTDNTRIFVEDDSEDEHRERIGRMLKLLKQYRDIQLALRNARQKAREEHDVDEFDLDGTHNELFDGIDSDGMRSALFDGFDVDGTSGALFDDFDVDGTSGALFDDFDVDGTSSALLNDDGVSTVLSSQAEPNILLSPQSLWPVREVKTLQERSCDDATRSAEASEESHKGVS